MTQRIKSLDVLRSVAIILVFLGHYPHLTGKPLFFPFDGVGGIGVDLFFALSGYLIGNQIFSSIAKGNAISFKKFYINRAFRILPNYCIVVFLYFTVPGLREAPLVTPLWQFLTFTQNLFTLQLPAAFSHAWTLCVEEHFYLAVPIAGYLFSKRKPIHIAWMVIAFILIGEIVLRSCMWYFYVLNAGDNLSSVYRHVIYAPTYARLDALTIGVALSIIKNFHVPCWKRLTQPHWGYAWLALGIIGYSWVGYVLAHDNNRDFFKATVYYTILAMSSGALVLSALSKDAWLSKIYLPGMGALAIGSYAIYLSHKMMIHLAVWTVENMHLAYVDGLLFAVALFATVSAGALLYFCVERPWIKIRDLLG